MSVTPGTLLHGAHKGHQVAKPGCLDVVPYQSEPELPNPGISST